MSLRIIVPMKTEKKAYLKHTKIHKTVLDVTLVNKIVEFLITYQYALFSDGIDS